MTRPRKPTAIKKLQGTLQKCRTNPGEPVPTKMLAEAPEDFSESVREIWNYALSVAPPNVLAAIDYSVFAVWCVAVDTFNQARTEVERTGLMAEGSMGQPTKNPAISIMNDAAYLMMKAASELGFTPASRSKVTVIATEKKKDELDDILG